MVDPKGTPRFILDYLLVAESVHTVAKKSFDVLGRIDTTDLVFLTARMRHSDTRNLLQDLESRSPVP